MEKDSQVYKENKKSIGRFFKSFKFSFEGMRYAFYHEQNLIVMFLMAIIAIVLGLVLKVNYVETLVIILLIGIVISLEMINTAIEAVVDLHDGDKKSKMGKVAKDSASGAVAFMSVIALIVGLMIFVPKIIDLLK